MLHRGPIAGIATRGDLIATAGYDNQIILWDAQRREALARACHDHLVNDCRFSADGRWLVSASSDYSARVWSVPQLRLHAVLGGHEDDVDMAVFAPDDQRIATCALDRCVRVFDREGRCLHEMRGHTGNVLALAWTSDGSQLVSSSVDGTIRRWDTSRGVNAGTTNLRIRTDSVEIGTEGTVFAGDDRGRIAIIDATGPRFVQAHRAGVKKIALNAQRTTLVSLSYDRSIALWRIVGPEGLEEISRSTLPETVWARAATVLDDGRIATGTFGACYALFDLHTLSWNLDTVAAGPAINAVLSCNGQVYSVGDAGMVHVDGVLLAQMGSLCNFLVACGAQVLTGGQLGRLFDAATGAVLHQHHSPLNCGVGFTRGGRDWVAVGTYTGEVLVLERGRDGGWNLTTSLPVYENAVKGLSYSDGILFSVCASTDVAWHAVGDWSLIRRVDKAHERIGNGCAAIGAGRFASVGRDRTLRLWSGAGVETYASPHPNSVKCIAVSGDGKSLMTGSYGGTVAGFDLYRKRWTRMQRPTAAGISSLAWDDSERRFLAGSYDGAIYPVNP
jgi:toxoflavin biosynthesis protein ToxC